MYGFHKLKNSNGYHEFRHEHFQKGNLSALAKIQRKLNEPTESKNIQSSEYKNLHLEFNRLQKANLEFEDSLAILVKQNKQLVEANRQLVYQFYYFKNESELKTKKILFLLYSMLFNSDPKIFSYFQKHFLEKILPQNFISPSRNNFLSGSENTSSKNLSHLPFNCPNPQILFEELQSNIDPDSINGKTLLSEMLEKIFSSDNGNNQVIDNTIQDCMNMINSSNGQLLRPKRPKGKNNRIEELDYVQDLDMQKHSRVVNKTSTNQLIWNQIPNQNMRINHSAQPNSLLMTPLAKNSLNKNSINGNLGQGRTYNTNSLRGNSHSKNHTASQIPSKSHINKQAHPVKINPMSNLRVNHNQRSIFDNMGLCLDNSIHHSSQNKYSLQNEINKNKLHMDRNNDIMFIKVKQPGNNFTFDSKQSTSNQRKNK